MPKLPQPVLPHEALQFLKHFKGHTTFTTISQSGIPVAYPSPNMSALNIILTSNNNGHNVYFTVNETSDSGRKKENIETIRAIFTDDDKPRSEPRTDWALPPSLIVITSGHSKYKFHYYWLTETRNVEQYENVMRGIIQKYDTDPNVHDLARILRVPGYVNYKNDPPSRSILVENNGKVYKWSEIIKAFPPYIPTEEEIKKSNEPHKMLNESEYRRKFILGEQGDITKYGNGLIAHWRNHLSDKKTLQKVDELLEDALSGDSPPEKVARYMEFRKQSEKFVRSIATKITRERSTSDNIHVITGTAEPLNWDWTLVKSSPIPEDCIPETLLGAAKEVGEWTGTGQDPAILSGMFITLALLGKNVLIHELGDALTTHCQSGICIAMTTGGRKSAIYEQMNEPFFQYEQDLKKEWAEQKYKVAAIVKALETDISKLDKEYAKLKEPSNNEREAYAIRRGGLDQQKDSLQVREPWLHSADVTEEKLVRKLADNNGSLAIISDDARQVINNLCGKYLDHGKSGESVYINGLTGSDIMYERVGSDKEIYIRKPALNALLFVQPDAALKLRDSEMFVPSGLAARLPMFFCPISGTDIVENTLRRSINKDLMEPYYNSLRRLCHRRIDNPLIVKLDDLGIQACRRMDKKFAELLKTEWRGHYDKSNKLITLSIMYATALASLEDPEFALAFRDNKTTEYIISTKYLNMGNMFATALFRQSIGTYDAIRYESLPRKAESFINTLSRWYKDGKVWEGFTMCGSLQQHTSKTYKDDLHEIIDFLHSKKWLYVTVMKGEQRKLNGGFPDKFVYDGDVIYHLNKVGIERLQIIELDNKGSQDG